MRHVLAAALLFATYTTGQCTITAPGTQVTPTPADSWQPIAPTVPFPIGFAFPFCGASYTDFYVTDHGMIAFTNGGTPASPPTGAYTYNPSGANLVLNSPKVAAYWSDHNISAAGSVRIDNANGGSHCTVTWLNAVTYGQTPQFTMQATLFPDGRIVLNLDNRVNNNGSSFTSSNPLNLTAVIGLTPGTPAVLPAASDLSASPVSADNTVWESWQTTAPNTPNPLFDVANKSLLFIPLNPGWIVLCTPLSCASNTTYGTGCNGLAVSSNSPVLGTIWTVTTTGIHPISPVGYVFVGAGRDVLGTPLTALGVPAPGCLVNISGLLADGATPASAGTSTSLPVPLNVTLKDALFTFQSAALVPFTVNAAGVATSNGGEVVVGF